MIEDIEIIDPYADRGLAPRVGLTLATFDEVKKAEDLLGASFPDGYREFVTALGKGTYYGWNTAIKVLMPSEILSGNKDRQEFLSEYWFWERSEDILPKNEAIESIAMCDNDIGDVVIFHPDAPEKLFVLPHEEESALLIGTNLTEAIDWLVECGREATGAEAGTHVRRAFVPFNQFVQTQLVIPPKGVYE
ncbi:MAG: SMI1/KNR4 family protein [Acidobacteriota bacterium]|nr:MAG: SMI1/KNR4 family protein [Acidobacteriota bacterium]